MDFAELAEHYLAGRIVCPEHRSNITRVARACGQATNENLNSYIRRRAGEVASITARNERGMLLSVWKHGYDNGLIDVAPRGIAKIKARRAPTQAWTVGQLKDILAAAEKKRGRRTRSGADLGAFLKAWILLGYESGSRLGDCWSFHRRHIEGDTLRWTQSKTGDPLSKLLSPACVDAVGKMLEKSPNGLVIGWVCSKRQATRVMRHHLESCGLGGTSKWLRRSGATHVEMEAPGTAKLHLGHRTPGLAERAYLDWAQIRTKTPRTPQLID